MPRSNRVDPFGRLHAVAERGALMGNRGCLHDDAGEIVRDWRGRAWISCRIDVPGAPRRPLAEPGRYTPLFFLDEPTALAAGHRPCGQCRRAALDRFRAAWSAAVDPDASITAIDRRLHDERIAGRRAWDGRALPDGAMVGSAEDGAAWLARDDRFHAWSFTGYGPASASPAAANLLLTPPSLVAVLGAGYAPEPGCG